MLNTYKLANINSNYGLNRLMVYREMGHYSFSRLTNIRFENYSLLRARHEILSSRRNRASIISFFLIYPDLHIHFSLQNRRGDGVG